MGRYIDALKRMNRAFDDILLEYGWRSKLRLYADAFFSRIIYGVTPNEYLGFKFYKKSKFEKRRFYTARHTNKMEKHFNSPQNADVFWKKQLFNERFSEYVTRGWIFVPDVSKDEFDDFVSKHSKIIIKPQDLSSGRGIQIYGGQSYEDLKKSNCLIEQFIDQHHEMSLLNESSVNSVRVYTVLDSKGEPHILSISIRVGAADSCVDNYHSGGVAYPVDIQSGMIYMPGKNIAGRPYIFHPGTNKKMIGFEIPNFKKMLEFVLKASLELPNSRLIAWDIAVLEDGFELIEGNYMGDPGLMQSTAEIGKLKELKKYY
ncbi:MAG: hypothetical protein E7622_06320 [Ruminococcaceae bacterium]|nr:hypothetical protein [Oscillospiraceae bacterium]